MKHLTEKYRFGFDFRALALFLIIMIPNFLWFAVPAPIDILRVESKTPVTDTIASVCQVILVFCLCFVVRRDKKPFRPSATLVGTALLVALYITCWILYYCGIAGVAVILGLTCFPCAAFMTFAVDRRNFIALIPTAMFTACHLIYAAMNFIL